MFDGIIVVADGGEVVAVYWDRWMRMTHLFEGELKNCCVFAIEEKSTKIGFGCRSYDKA